MTGKIETRLAPDFTLVDVNGQAVSLSDHRGKKHMVLVFNRGFM
jgi:peroxiredoxin